MNARILNARETVEEQFYMRTLAVYSLAPGKVNLTLLR
jgi:hypothetical protein